MTKKDSSCTLSIKCKINKILCYHEIIPIASVHDMFLRIGLLNSAWFMKNNDFTTNQCKLILNGTLMV